MGEKSPLFLFYLHTAHSERAVAIKRTIGKALNGKMHLENVLFMYCRHVSSPTEDVGK